MLAMTYGYEAQEHGDRIVEAAQRLNKFAIETILPGALLVNYLHFRMWSGIFHTRIDLLHALQCATSPNGFHGLVINH